MSWVVDVLPVILRLREGSPSALVTQWPVVNIAPEKNIAYAIQWFAMSVALVLFYLFLSFRRETKSDVINEVTHG
jgi:surfeit locus 1 family protein